MTAFTITKYIYLRNQTPTPQGLVSSGIDRDASEWTKSPGGNLTLVMEATPTGGVNLTLRRANETLECLDVEEISRKFAGVYDKSNPPIVAICKQNGIGFKYLVRRFHVMTYRFQVKFAYNHEYERAVELLENAGVCIKGRPAKRTPAASIHTPAATQEPHADPFRDFNPESQWDDLTEDDSQIDPSFLPSKAPIDLDSQLPNPSQPRMSQSFSQLSQPFAASSQPAKRATTPPVSSQPKRLNSQSNWRTHFTPVPKSSGPMLSRGTQTETPNWLLSTREMEQHIISVTSDPSFEVYVARIREALDAESGIGHV